MNILNMIKHMSIKDAYSIGVSIICLLLVAYIYMLQRNAEKKEDKVRRRIRKDNELKASKEKLLEIIDEDKEEKSFMTPDGDEVKYNVFKFKEEEE